jgi:hypothetical protein
MRLTLDLGLIGRTFAIFRAPSCDTRPSDATAISRKLAPSSAAARTALRNAASALTKVVAVLPTRVKLSMLVSVSVNSVDVN